MRDGASFCICVFIIIRVALSALAVIGVHEHTVESGVVGATGTGKEVRASPGWHNAIDGADRWDAAWFGQIAGHGYRDDDASAAFFPAYPLAIRTIDFVLPIGTLGAALLVSNVAFLGALLVLYALTTLEFSESVARRTVLLVACFPSSFFFLAPYSESLFLFATLLAYWWVRTDRWPYAGVAGLVASITRSIGVVLVPALLVEAATRTRRWRPAARTLWLVLPVLGPMLYMTYWIARGQDALRPFHAQTSWMRSVQFPLITIGDAISLGVRGIGDPRGIYWTGDVVVACLLLVPLALGWRKLRPTYLTYVGLSLLIPLTYPLPARPFLSMPRFVVVLFPLFWLLADELKHRVGLLLVTGVFLAGFAILSLSFMNWGFVF
jgi:Mannosyltransferase (PIG-V)